MPNSNRPFAPGYNRLIETDPQIVKAPGVTAEKFTFDWGARPSLLKHMSGNPASSNPSQPSAPEMSVRHTKDMG